MALAPLDHLASVLTTLLSADARGLDRLGVHYVAALG
jgi:hypothetical protein